MDLALIGQTIKDRRIKMGKSIREIASACEISPSTISMIENGKTSPNLLTLKAVCDALNIPVFSLLLDEDEDRIRLVRRSNQITFIRNASNGQSLVERLIIQGKNEMFAATISVPPHTDSGDYAHHGGEEFVFVLKGTVTYDLQGKRKYELSAYDTLYYPNYIGHRWENNTDEEVEILLVSTSPYKF